jgi:hypothetical protein
VSYDGKERPILYHSQSLSASQQRYAYNDEYFGVFRKFLYGRKFLLVVNNLTLKNLLTPLKGLPIIASPQMQLWSVTQLAYDFDVEFHNSFLLAAADVLSSLPQPTVT